MPASSIFPENRLVTTRYGQKMWVAPSDEIGRKIIKQGVYDRKGVYILDCLLKGLGDAVALDIGANIGNHTLVMSRHARQVLAFEPQPEVFQILSRNIEANGITNVRAHPVGLSDCNDSLVLYTNLEGNSGGSTFNPKRRPGHHLKVRSEVRIGDEFLASQGVDRVDLIKIDVEGYELEVLKGLAKTIREHQPIVVIEWNDGPAKRRAQDENLFATLLGGYVARRGIGRYNNTIWRDRPLAPLRRAVGWALHRRQWVLTNADLAENYSNLVMIPASKLDLVSQALPSPSPSSI